MTPAKVAPDVQMIADAIHVLAGSDDVIEIRALVPRGKKHTDAGYFDAQHRQQAAEAAARLNAAGAAVYLNLNPIDSQLLARYANRIESWVNDTTTDANVIGRRWLPIDFDPRRPKGTSATDEQLTLALTRAQTCRDYLRELGWPDPIEAESGNGAHLLYPINLPNDDTSRDAIKAVLAALGNLFDDEKVSVDQTVFNAGRIWKLYGTVANKGDPTTFAPWRLSRIVNAPTRDRLLTLDAMQALEGPSKPVKVALMPAAPAADRSAPSGTWGRPSFDLDAFLARLGIAATHDRHEGRDRYRLDRCPFNPEHGRGEAAIFRAASGALGFKCQHDSCAGKKWQDVRTLVDGPPAQRRRARAADDSGTGSAAPSWDDRAIAPRDFYSVLPQHKYLYVPTRDLWPAESIDGCLSKEIRRRLDVERAVVQMTWHPDEPLIIDGRVVADGGWVQHAGVEVVNLYRAPASIGGDAGSAGKWRDHLRRIYPDEADHIEHWLAHRIQHPGQKINHALVLGGAQGIGKDTLLEPVKHGVGPWNWQEISPAQMLGRFNGWVKSVVVRVSEARDLGDVDRFAFYDHSKVYIAAPPDVIRVDEKNLREHPVFNVTGVIITTNHKTDGIYLPADDRRHFVAWSECDRAEFDGSYWPDLWGWYEAGGIGHVVAFLRTLDLSRFDPKAPPPKTAAFFAIVAANSAPEDAELRDVIERAGTPDVLTLDTLIGNAEALGLQDLAFDLRDRKSRRALPHKLERAGYVPVRNPDAADGLFKIGNRRQSVYGKRTQTTADQLRAARRLLQAQPWARAA